jgi:transcriptional regulator with XRE-family HTH domain
MSAEMIDEGIADRLKEERARLGLSQAKVAKILGMGQQNYNRYEHGLNRVALDFVMSCGKAGMDADYILTGKRSSNKEPSIETKPESAHAWPDLNSFDLGMKIGELQGANRELQNTNKLLQDSIGALQDEKHQLLEQLKACNREVGRIIDLVNNIFNQVPHQTPIASGNTGASQKRAANAVL